MVRIYQTEKQTENRHDPYSKVLSQNSKILLQKGLTTQNDIWQYKDSSILRKRFDFEPQRLLFDSGEPLHITIQNILERQFAVFNL